MLRLLSIAGRLAWHARRGRLRLAASTPDVGVLVTDSQRFLRLRELHVMCPTESEGTTFGAANPDATRPRRAAVVGSTVSTSNPNPLRPARDPYERLRLERRPERVAEINDVDISRASPKHRVSGSLINADKDFHRSPFTMGGCELEALGLGCSGSPAIRQVGFASPDGGENFRMKLESVRSCCSVPARHVNSRPEPSLPVGQRFPSRM